MKCPACLSDCDVDAKRCACGHAFSNGKTPHSHTAESSSIRGALIGALVGAIGRSLVTFFIMYYLQSVNAEFIRGNTDLQHTSGLLAYCTPSAGIGLVIGAMTGATCRPWLGALMGGGLSGASCLCLAFLPVNLMLALSGGGKIDYSTERVATVVGLFAMIMVGAIAGGIGGASGKRRGDAIHETPTEE